MKKISSAFMTAMLLTLVLYVTAAWAQAPRWPEQKAIAWYLLQPWLVGSNYIPKSAINQLEMWQEVLPIATQERVEAINWGFVAGKTQTYLPWESWEHPYILDQPPVWFHEVLQPDGTPYRQAEVDLIRTRTGKK